LPEGLRKTQDIYVETGTTPRKATPQSRGKKTDTTFEVMLPDGEVVLTTHDRAESHRFIEEESHRLPADAAGFAIRTTRIRTPASFRHRLREERKAAKESARQAKRTEREARRQEREAKRQAREAYLAQRTERWSRPTERPAAPVVPVADLDRPAATESVKPGRRPGIATRTSPAKKGKKKAGKVQAVVAATPDESCDIDCVDA